MDKRLDRQDRFELVSDAVTRYPEPDWTGTGTVVQIGLKGDQPVGYLVLQGDKLAWLTNAGPDLGWAYGIRLAVEEQVAAGLRADRTAADVLFTITRDLPVMEVHLDDLAELTATLRGEWKI